MFKPKKKIWKLLKNDAGGLEDEASEVRGVLEEEPLISHEENALVVDQRNSGEDVSVQVEQEELESVESDSVALKDETSLALLGQEGIASVVDQSVEENLDESDNVDIRVESWQNVAERLVDTNDLRVVFCRWRTHCFSSTRECFPISGCCW